MIINGTNRRINGSDVITRNHLREMVEERNMTVVKLLFRILRTSNPYVRVYRFAFPKLKI